MQDSQRLNAAGERVLRIETAPVALLTSVPVVSCMLVVSPSRARRHASQIAVMITAAPVPSLASNADALV